MEIDPNYKMIVVRGDGRILKDLDRAGVIEALKQAHAEKDRFASVIGAICAGLDVADLEKEAGYRGASYNETLQSLQKFSRK